MQARTCGASKAATTAQHHRRGSWIRRRAKVRPPPRPRRTTAWWMSLPTRGAARGAPPRTRTSLTTHTCARTHTQVYQRRRQLRPAEHRAGRGSTGLHAALRARCADWCATFSLGAGRTAFVHPIGLAPSPLHSCTKLGRTRSESAPNCAALDDPGVSIPGVVAGVFGYVFVIVGALILYKTWRVLAVKRGSRNVKDVVILGGGKAAYLCRQMVASTGLLVCAGAAAVAGAASTAAFIGFDVAMEVFQLRA